MGSGVKLINSAQETALEVAETLRRRGQLLDDGSAVSRTFATTGDAGEFGRLGARVFGEALGEVEEVGVEQLKALPSAEALELARVVEEELACA